MSVGLRQNKIGAFKRVVLSYFKKHGRDLPWRQTHDSYKILVSEIMLQQTQVDRVIPKYNAFLKKFPTISTIASAPLASVLTEWQGLGYNRRAKMLHNAAKSIIVRHGGLVPETFKDLCALPGIGTYTAHAIRVFSHNKPDVLIETNVRTVFIHHFFPKRSKVTDEELLPLIAATLDSRNPRQWYSALMDYGAYLKSTVGNFSRKSAHHVEQKKFKGSDREVRGVIIKILLKGKSTLAMLPFKPERIKTNAEVLVKEGLIRKRSAYYFLG